MKASPLAPMRGAPASVFAPDDADAGPAAGEQRRVLIVEDEYLVAMEIEAALADAGFAVVGVAARASEAIRLAKAAAPDLIVMDIRLAGVRDGIEAATEIYNTIGIRCIFATAHAEPALRRRAAAAAPIGWIAKPYHANALIALIRDALREPKQ